MKENLNWTGNRVMNPGAPRSTYPTSLPVQNELNNGMEPPLTQQGPPLTQQGPPPTTEEGYIPNFLRRHIGRNVRAEFVVGSNQFVDKSGRIQEVGINYFVLDDFNARTYVMCDLYSVKFVTLLAQ